MEEKPKAAKSIVDAGHQIQNHTWSHPLLTKLDRSQIREQLEKTQKIIKKIVNITPTKIRPPYGAGGWPTKLSPKLKEVADQLSLEVRNWDIDTIDWKAPAGIGGDKLKDIESQIKSQERKTELNVLMHVINPTAKDLPSFIAKLKAWGFVFAAP